ncbi:hypothetical protein NXS19_011468 [Fusarium pseudograminearum]|nr:hypothetical protein NXS19_011468 [Fusarium pseudograminearum]
MWGFFLRTFKKSSVHDRQGLSLSSSSYAINLLSSLNCSFPSPLPHHFLSVSLVSSSGLLFSLLALVSKLSTNNNLGSKTTRRKLSDFRIDQ